jgi:hypothetical protein
MSTSAPATEITTFLRAQLGRAGEPISDSHAQRSQALEDEAIDLRFPYVHDATVPQHSERIVTLLRESVELDPRNTSAMIVLARMDEAPARVIAPTISLIADRALRFLPEQSAASEVGWSIGSREERQFVHTLTCCALSLDAAEYYGAADRLRRKVLRVDSRDGGGLRFNVTAHALMVGDLRTSARWLRWAVRNDQTPAFWCWARVLHERLAGAVDFTGHLNAAVEAEPFVPDFVVNGTDSSDSFSYRFITGGSVEEQEHHASILRRAWMAHPDDFEWLIDVVDAIYNALDAADQGEQEGT